MAICLNDLFDTDIKEVEISTDTRTIKNGDFFLPLVGENFDGHNFINEALAKGALGSFCLEERLDEIKNKLEDKSKELIPVSNTLITYHKLANLYRKRINPKVIAITGSSGKTTTKELMRLVAAEKYKVHYTHANFNNEVGVPKTILEMPPDTEVLILEMGMRAQGEISILSRTAEPDIAIITNIGSAHLERLGSIENIRKAKLEITSGLKENGLLAVNQDLFDKINQNHGELSKKHVVKFFNDAPSYSIKGLVGPGIFSDINAVVLVAKEIGIGIQQIITGLNKYAPLQGRGNFLYDERGNIFIDDSYNANPDSVRFSIDAVMNQFPNDQKVLVIGKILESDPKLIQEVYAYIEELIKKQSSANLLKLIKAEDREIEDVVDELKKLTHRGKKTVTLIKGSRGAKLERILEHFNLSSSTTANSK